MTEIEFIRASELLRDFKNYSQSKVYVASIRKIFADGSAPDPIKIYPFFQAQLIATKSKKSIEKFILFLEETGRVDMEVDMDITHISKQNHEAVDVFLKKERLEYDSAIKSGLNIFISTILNIGTRFNLIDFLEQRNKSKGSQNHVFKSMVKFIDSVPDLAFTDEILEHLDSEFKNYQEANWPSKPTLPQITIDKRKDILTKLPLFKQVILDLLIHGSKELEIKEMTFQQLHHFGRVGYEEYIQLMRPRNLREKAFPNFKKSITQELCNHIRKEIDWPERLSLSEIRKIMNE